MDLGLRAYVPEWDGIRACGKVWKGSELCRVVPGFMLCRLLCYRLTGSVEDCPASLDNCSVSSALYNHHLYANRMLMMTVWCAVSPCVFYRFICSGDDCPASPDSGASKQLIIRGGGAIGALMLKTSRFVAERGLRVATCQSPFRDQHGEDWSTANWGRPLRLKPEVYGALSDMWAATGFEFDSYMLHHSMSLV